MNIFNTLLQIFETSKEKNIPTDHASNILAEMKLKKK